MKSTPVDVLTACVIKPEFGSAINAGPNSRYARSGDPQVADIRSRCADNKFTVARTGGTNPQLSLDPRVKVEGLQCERPIDSG